MGDVVDLIDMVMGRCGMGAGQIARPGRRSGCVLLGADGVHAEIGPDDLVVGRGHPGRPGDLAIVGGLEENKIHAGACGVGEL